VQAVKHIVTICIFAFVAWAIAIGAWVFLRSH
jgi:hypothetical protein